MGRLETATSIRWAVWKAPLLGLRSTVELDRLAPLFEENFTHFDKERRFTNRRLISVGGLESAPPRPDESVCLADLGWKQRCANDGVGETLPQN